MLINDQCAPQRDHHQNAEQAASNRNEHDACDFQIETEDKYCRHGHPQTERDGFAGRAGSLHNIIFEDRRVAQTELGKEPEKRDRKDSDRNGRAYRQPYFEHEIK